MKRLNLFILTFTLLLSQLGMLEHAYSEHQSGEVCDFCLSAPSLDNTVTHVIKTDFSNNLAQLTQELASAFIAKSSTRFYATRAPPCFI